LVDRPLVDRLEQRGSGATVQTLAEATLALVLLCDGIGLLPAYRPRREADPGPPLRQYFPAFLNWLWRRTCPNGG
jgi:DNA-binding transcriptional LysR family regulator